MAIYFGALGEKKLYTFLVLGKKHIKWFPRKNMGFHSVLGSHEALSKTLENAVTVNQGWDWGEYGFLLLHGKSQMGRWTYCMLLSLCLWSPREEEQIVHLYGLFLGLKTDGGGWDFKEIRLKK